MVIDWGSVSSFDEPRAVYSLDGRFKVWDANTGALLHDLAEHGGSISLVAVSAGGTRVVAVSNDGTLTVWDTEKGQRLHRLLFSTDDAVTCLAVSADGTRAISGTVGGRLTIWDTHLGTSPRDLEPHGQRVRGVAISADGTRAASVSDDGTLRVWALGRWQPIATFGADAGILSCAMSGDGVTSIAGDSLGRVHLLRLEDA